jgi:hypothetical protein
MRFALATLSMVLLRTCALYLPGDNFTFTPWAFTFLASLDFRDADLLAAVFTVERDHKKLPSAQRQTLRSTSHQKNVS